jgi:biopolymer transport protein ExbB
MQRLLMLTLLCLSTLLTPLAAQAWWQDDWNYRKPIVIDTTPEGAALNDRVGRMPLLVRLHTGNFAFDGTQDKGGDLRFVAADDKTVLNYQIEDFDPLMGIAHVWVDIPEVVGGQKQTLWMYYGNAKAPATTNGQLTFDPDYTLVYHFDSAPGAAPRDATAYANNAQTPPGGLIDGILGHAAQFTGAAPMMLPASPSLAIPAVGAFTFSAWIRPDQPTGEQLIYARHDSGNTFLIGLAQGQPFVEINGQRSAATQPVTAAQWQHLAVTASANGVILYLNGRPVGNLAVALPPLNSVAAIGGDVIEAAPAEVAGASPENGAAAGNRAFIGAIDELRLSKVARSPALLMSDYLAQGADSKLVVYGTDEKQSGFGFGSLGFLLNAVPVDAWVIIAILCLMMIQSWVIMIRKNRNVSRVELANKTFRMAFANVGTRLETLADDAPLANRLQHSTLWRIYAVAVHELRTRRSQSGGRVMTVSLATLEAIRASMDSVRTEENRKLGARMGILSNAIAGGPYIGLLGTVLGIMVVFLGTAMAGDVNINAVAPGMAAALLATAMGLLVAIPALFGYNRLVARNRNVSADMRVFLDEFIARMAEVYGSDAREPAAPSAVLPVAAGGER